MLVQVQARKLTALDLKKQALAAKQSGSVEEAIEYLRQAKKIEQEEGQDDDDDDDENDEPPFSSTLPLFWKKVAVLCKQKGDLDRAKQALLHSKELESGRETETETEPPAPASPPASPPTPTQTQPQTPTGGESNIPPPSYDHIGSFKPPPPPSYGNVVGNEKGGDDNDDEAVDEEEAAMFAEWMGGGGTSQSASATAAPVAASVGAGVGASVGVGARTNPISGADDSDSNHGLEPKSNAMAFTDEELMDEEMMTEFRLGEVQGIPTQEEYAAKVLSYKKLALKCKQEGDIPKATQNLRAAKQLEKVALALKAMDDGSASGMGMESGANEDLSGIMETLNPEEFELLGELFEPSSNNGAEGIEVGEATTDRLTVEDLENMNDDNDVIEMVEMMGPDALPMVEELAEKITQLKQEALSYKQEGYIEMAKSSLLQSKKVKLQAVRLAEIYRKLEARRSNGGADGEDHGETDQAVSMEALEALVSGGETTPKAKPAPKPAPPAPPKDPWLLKSSSEIKAEVIRLKNENQVKEATRLLLLLKRKIAEEKHQADLERRSKLTAMIQKRADVAKFQRRLWQHYHWFGTEAAVGRGQYQEWTKFEKDCNRAIHLIRTEGSDSVELGPRVQDAAKTKDDSSADSTTGKKAAVAKKLYMLDDDVLSLVETCTNATTASDADSTDDVTNSNHLDNNALEVAVMGLFDMEQNEKLQKILSKQPKREKASYECPDLRINAKLQLPIHMDDASKPVFMDFDPSEISMARRASTETTPKSQALQFRYGFDPSSKSCRQQVGLPRKDPKHERVLLKKMETKTIQLSVYYLHNQKKRQEAAARKKAAEAKAKSWFFGFKGSEPKPSEAEPGEGDPKDVFVGKVTIDFKQLLSRGCIAGDFPIMVNSREIGGVLRVCLRTRPVMDPDQYDGVPLVTEDGKAPSPSIKTYKNGLAFVFKDKDGDETTNIEAIKHESD